MYSLCCCNLQAVEAYDLICLYLSMTEKQYIYSKSLNEKLIPDYQAAVYFQVESLLLAQVSDHNICPLDLMRFRQIINCTSRQPGSQKSMLVEAELHPTKDQFHGLVIAGFDRRRQNGVRFRHFA